MPRTKHSLNTVVKSLITLGPGADPMENGLLPFWKLKVVLFMACYGITIDGFMDFYTKAIKHRTLVFLG
jgi:hypothetical protein